MDLAINTDSGSIATFRKDTAAFNNYVPWCSFHSSQCKINLASNLFYRATRINNTSTGLEIECLRIELALLSLGYPIYLISKQKRKALSYAPKDKEDLCTPLIPQKYMYFTTTRNEVTSGRDLQIHMTRICEILKESPYFKNVIFKRFFRQPPSLSSSLIQHCKRTRFLMKYCTWVKLVSNLISDGRIIGMKKVWPDRIPIFG